MSLFFRILLDFLLGNEGLAGVISCNPPCNPPVLQKSLEKSTKQIPEMNSQKEFLEHLTPVGIFDYLNFKNASIKKSLQKAVV